MIWDETAMTVRCLRDVNLGCGIREQDHTRFLAPGEGLAPLDSVQLDCVGQGEELSQG